MTNRPTAIGASAPEPDPEARLNVIWAEVIDRVLSPGLQTSLRASVRLIAYDQGMTTLGIMGHSEFDRDSRYMSLLQRLPDIQDAFARTGRPRSEIRIKFIQRESAYQPAGSMAGLLKAVLDASGKPTMVAKALIRECTDSEIREIIRLLDEALPN